MEELGRISIQDTPSSLAEQLAKYAAFNMDNSAIKPHLICKGGLYIIYLNGELVSCGSEAVQALDTFFKCFDVFALSVPSALIKLIDFMEVFCYKIKPHSSRQTVNTMCAKLAESFDAEN